MRKRIYEILEVGEDDDIASRAYDLFMMASIIISIAPLMTKTENRLTYDIDKITAGIFIVDYILRLLTADFKIKKGASSFIRYPLPQSAMGIYMQRAQLDVLSPWYRLCLG